MTKIVQIQKYCTEIDWNDLLESNCINLIVAPTGSGKTHAFVTHSSRDKDIAVVAPFTSITEQIFLSSEYF